MENVLIVARQVAILFLLIGVGAAVRRFRLVDTAAIGGIVNVLFLIVTPCLILDVFQRPFDPAMLRGLVQAFLFAFGIHAVMIALAVRLFARGKAAATSVLKVATVFSNAGFMGLPLEQAILGDRGVFYGIVYVVVFNLLMWSWGLSVMRKDTAAPEESSSKALRAMLVNPGTVGVTLGLAVFLLPWNLPDILREPVSMLASLNTPLAMLVIGFYLAGAKLGAILRRPAAYAASALRLVAAPLIVTAALWPFRHALDHTMMLAVVIPAAAPVGAMVTMFAYRYARDVDLSVALVSGTTLASIVTMPPIVALAMHVLK